MRITATLMASLATCSVLTACDTRSPDLGQPVTAEPPIAEFPRPKAAAGICHAADNITPLPTTPDRVTALSEMLRRGGLKITAESLQATTAKDVSDGSIADWVGEAAMVGGLAYQDQGEHIYTDFLYDSWGADDGQDAQRVRANLALSEQYAGYERSDQLFQALGDQFGAPAPAGALDHYGDATDITEALDLSELRWAADSDALYFLARYSRLIPTDSPVMVLLFDSQADLPAAELTIKLGELDTGVSTTIYDQAILISRTETLRYNLITGESLATDTISGQIIDDGFINALEYRIEDLSLALEGELRVAGFSAKIDGDNLIPANLAWRFDELEERKRIVPCDPVAGIYNDRSQALDLFTGNIDGYMLQLEVDGLQNGYTQSYELTGGYFERQFISNPDTSHEDPESLGYEDPGDPLEPYEQTIRQAYGLFLPYDYDPSETYPLSFWTHFQGGKTHSGGAWIPRYFHQLGEEKDGIVVAPRGRGTKSWYIGVSHQDIWEVYADVAGSDITGTDVLYKPDQFPATGLANIDKNQVYMAGYSMGGYCTYTFALMYPDKFAGGYSTSGVFVSSGVNGSINLLDNAQHLPIVIHHGSNDEFVVITSVLPAGQRLQELGYRNEFTTFAGYEHYTQAIVDEWADGADYLFRYKHNGDPREVTYKVIPAYVQTINNNRSTLYGAGTQTNFNFDPDGAWWLDDIRVRLDGGCDRLGTEACDDTFHGIVSAESFAIPGKEISTNATTVNGTSTPAGSPGAHSTPYTRTGIEWTEGADKPLSNNWQVTATNVKSFSLDFARMGLDATSSSEGRLTIDGETTVNVNNIGSAVEVFVNDVSIGTSNSGNTTITLSVFAGEQRIRFEPI